MKRKKLILLSTVILLLVAFATVAFASNGNGSFFHGLKDIATFFRNIFVPSENYFNNQLSVLNDRLNKKLGGVAFLFHFLNYFFDSMKNVPATSMNISIPNNFFFSGYKGFTLNLFSTAQPYIRMLRGVLTAVVALITSIAVYHKLRTLFRE